MLELFKAGGPSMIGVLGFGLAALIAGGLFARKPEAGRLGFIVGMSLATLFMALAGTSMDLAAVMGNVPKMAEAGVIQPGEVSHVVMQGIAESASPTILGFTLLALVAFVVGIGSRRMNRAAA